MKTLVLQRLHKNFKNSGKLINALSDVSLEFDSSKVYGIIGPNGAGKTTLIKTVCGLIYPDEGNVFINGESLYPENFRLLSQIGAILEGSRNIFWNFTPIQNVKYFAMLKGVNLKTAIDRAVQLFRLFGLEDKINSPVRNLSQGMKQKIAIIISTLHNPTVLLLDEPTLGLDPVSSQNMQKLIKELSYNDGKTVILTSHHLDIIEKNCDYLVFMKGGKILSFDTIDNIKSRFSEKTYIITLKDGNDIKKIEKKIPKDGFGSFMQTINTLKVIDIETREATLEEIFIERGSYS